MLLPLGYPLSDIQCTGCIFRAQVKTNKSKPRDKVLGATWDVMNHHTTSGHIIPPLFVNFKWDDKQEIRFYPFIPKENLKFRQLSPTAKRANLKMFDYVGLNELPHFLLYKNY